jgi:hypothetical protein
MKEEHPRRDEDQYQKQGEQLIPKIHEKCR